MSACRTCKAPCEGARCDACRAKQASEARERRSRWQPGQPRWIGFDRHAALEGPVRILVAARHRVWGPDISGNYYSRCRADIIEVATGFRAYLDTGVCDQTGGSTDALGAMLIQYLELDSKPFTPRHTLAMKHGVQVLEATVTVGRKGDL